jgi:MscS family membrane protein
VGTLLTAITVARLEDRKAIQDAAACLDLSGLPANQQNTAGLLATQLEAILRAKDVDTKLIPEEAKDGVYVLSDEPGQRIALRRLKDGRWLFDPETVALIPKLYAETQKHRQDKNKETAALSVSPELALARATFRTVWEAWARGDLRRVSACLDLSEVPAVAREEVGTLLAGKLRQIILRHRLPILQEIPDSNFSDPHVLLSQPEGVIELVRVPSGPRKGEWLFSRDTVGSLDKLFLVFEDRPYVDEVLDSPGGEVVKPGWMDYLRSAWAEPELALRFRLPGWLRVRVLSTRSFSLEVYELLGCVLVPLVAFGLHRLTTWLLTGALQWLMARRGWPLPREITVKRLRPVGRFVGVVFLRWGLLLVEPNQVVRVPLLVVLNPLVWLLGMWAVFRLIDLLGDVMEAHLVAQKRRPGIAQMLVPVSSLAVKIALFVVTMFHLMALFSWDVTAVLTGLGIGGLAFALGAQDALKNLFGSFTLLVDRPFVVGESVKIGNHDVGVVEVVGLRSTRIRTAEDTLLIVPNSSLTTADITNFGRRRYRRFSTRIRLAYPTSLEKTTAFRDGIQEVIRKHERTRKDQFEVAINDLAGPAIEVLVNVYFEVTDRREELEARDALVVAILRLAEELHIELAK